MKKWKKTDELRVSWIKTYKCPCCSVGIFEFINTEHNGILVNIESKGKVYIKDFWVPSQVCNNPMCKWSKVKIDSLNLSSRKEAWKESERE